MTDHYSVLSIEPGASREEVDAAFQEALAARRLRRAKTSDLHAAYAVLGDPLLRKAYDMARVGQKTGERLASVSQTAVRVSHELAPEIDWHEVSRSSWQAALKATVLVSGAAAKTADMTASLARFIQSQAARRIVD